MDAFIEKNVFAYKNNSLSFWIVYKWYNFSFWILYIYRIHMYTFSYTLRFFSSTRREKTRLSGVFTTICHTYIHPRKKNILCVCEDQFQRLSVSLRRWMIIKTDNTSTCFIDCLMSGRRKRNVEGGDIYLRWHFQYIYILVLSMIVIKYTRVILSHLWRNSSNCILNGYPFFRISHIWSTPE
jgi:hypothetical protein